MRFLIILAIISYSLSGCGQDKNKTDHAEAACAQVTDKNWHNPDWGHSKTSKQMCEHEFALFDQSVTDNKFYPCTFGDLPFFCQIKNGGGVQISEVVGGSRVVWISKDNVARTAPHLVIFK